MNRKKFLTTTLSATLASLGSPVFKTVKSIRKSKNSIPKVVRASEGKILNVIGDMQTIKLTGKDTNGQLTLIEEDNAPGTMIPLHVHANEDEVFKVLEGQLEVTVGDNTIVLNAGDMAFAPRGIPHTWKVVGDQRCKTILSAFPSGIETMFEELAELPAGHPDFPRVAEICGRYGIQFV